jgi:TolA-binding protein
MLEMKNSNQIESTMKSITSRIGQAEERISGVEGKIEEILHSDTNKEKT